MDDISTGSESDYSNVRVTWSSDWIDGEMWSRADLMMCRWIAWFLSTKGNVRVVLRCFDHHVHTAVSWIT
jgi:hypothetical protein